MKRGVLITGTCRGCSTEFEYAIGGRPREWCSEKCRKRSYDQSCVDCGTRINGTTPSRSTGRCGPCAKAEFSRRVRAAHIASIRRWAAIYGEPPAVPDWSTTRASQLKDRARAERARSEGWPSAGAVIQAFGTWNAAIEAAGFIPRRAGGHQRKRTAVAA